MSYIQMPTWLFACMIIAICLMIIHSIVGQILENNLIKSIFLDDSKDEKENK